MLHSTNMERKMTNNIMFSDFSVAICTKQRLWTLKRTIRSIFLQSLLPKKILVVNTTNNIAPTCVIKKIKIRSKQVVLIVINIKDCRSMNISKSRNIALRACGEAKLVFVDDDVTLNKTVFSKLLRVMCGVKKIFAVTGKIVPTDRSSVSQYLAYTHNAVAHDYVSQIVPYFGNTTILIDMNKQRHNNIMFNETISSGEDTLFYNSFATRGEHILYYPKIEINHDFLRGNVFNFIKRFWWYAASIPKLNKINPDLFGEIEIFLPRKNQNSFLLFLFYIIKPARITFHEFKKGFFPRKYVFFELIKNYVYLWSINYHRL